MWACSGHLGVESQFYCITLGCLAMRLERVILKFQLSHRDRCSQFEAKPQKYLSPRSYSRSHKKVVTSPSEAWNAPPLDTLQPTFAGKMNKFTFRSWLVTCSLVFGEICKKRRLGAWIDGRRPRHHQIPTSISKLSGV